MRAALIPFSQMSHQKHFLGLLGQGLEAHGVKVHWRSDGQEPEADFVAVWGWRRGAIYKQRGHRVLVLERGYLGDRFAWTSLGWDGLNNRARFCIDRAPADRGEAWRHLLKPLRPVEETGRVILMGQVAGDASLQHINIRQWYREAVDAIRRAGFDCAFRAHPVSAERGGETPSCFVLPPADLADDLASAVGVVTFNSNSGVDAVLAGVPTIAADAGSMVHGLVPDALPFKRLTERSRRSWLNRMAYCQWSDHELAAGAFWPHLGKGIDA